MKNVISYLKALWSRVAGSQRNDVEFDRRLTVGSPSGFTINWTLTIGIGNAWGAKITYTFTSKSWGASPANWTSGKDGNALTSGQGIQVTTGVSGANGTSPISFTNISKIEVKYCTNASKGAGTIKVQVGSGEEKTFSVTKPSSGGTTLKTATFSFSPEETGKVKVTGLCTANSVYVSSVTIYYETSITLDKNSGAANGSAKYNHEATTNNSFTAVTRDGYNCTGYYTASSGGTKILTETGAIAGANITISGTAYTSSSKWAYEGATLTLYAQWESSGGGSTPEITTSVSTLSNIGYSTVDFSRVVGSFTVSGSNLTNNVTVTPNSHHEICLTENGTYQTTAIELSKGSGTLAATTIYVRMRSGKAAGSYGGNIACASSGATTKNVNTTGNVPFTIQWYANGTLYHTSYAPYATGTGSNLGDLPTPDPNPITYSCDDKVFMGWYDGASYSHATDAPAYVTPTTKITSDKTFRAVFATEEAGGEPTAYSAGDEGDFVLASYNTSDSKWYAIPTSPTVSSGKITGVEISVSTSAGSVDYVTGANATGYTWTIADATNGQTISDGTKYLYHSNGGASGTNLDYGNGTTYTWTIESETGGLTFQGNISGTVKDRGMLFNGSVFGGYSLSNEDASGYYRIQVLPIGGMTYSDFNTTCTSCSNSVTVSYSAPGSGNTMTVQKGGASVSSGDALKTCSGVTLTVTLTATTHFTVGGLSATGVTGVTTTNVGNVYTVTIPADKTGTLTLTPTFTEDAYRTIVFKSNGSALFNDGGSATTFDGTNKWKQKVYLEAKPVWPTDLTSVQVCDGSSTSFRGWVADGQTWSGKKDAVPAGSTLITDASGFAAAASGSGDVVYHAVWAEASGSGTPHYAKVTSTGDITNGDYLIVYETGSVAFDGSLTTLDATSNTIDITISESKITANSTINASKFTIDVANRYIKSASDKYIDQSGWSNGLAGNDAVTSVHSMSIDGSGNFVVEGTGNDGAGTPTYVQLKYNAENSQKRFRFYKSGQGDIQLYKYDAGATYSNYLTTCCENYAVTLTGSGVVGGGTFSASSMQPCVGSTVELSATLCSGYTQGAWTVAKTGTPATTVTVTNNQFTMPSYAVTVSLATTAKVDHFIDRMHNTDGYTGDGAERSGCNYTVPNLSNTSEPVGSNCDEMHYIFVGWVDAEHVGSNGALLTGYSIISGNSKQNATGTTYYAIWAQAE